MEKIKSNKTSEYLFIYLDKKGNILQEKIVECYSKKHSLNLANWLFQNSLINDLHRIKTSKITYLR